MHQFYWVQFKNNQNLIHQLSRKENVEIQPNIIAKNLKE